MFKHFICLVRCYNATFWLISPFLFFFHGVPPNTYKMLLLVNIITIAGQNPYLLSEFRRCWCISVQTLCILWINGIFAVFLTVWQACLCYTALKRGVFWSFLHKGKDVCSRHHGLSFWVYWTSLAWCLLSAAPEPCRCERWVSTSSLTGTHPHFCLKTASVTAIAMELCAQQARCACLKEFSSNINAPQGLGVLSGCRQHEHFALLFFWGVL